MALSLENLFWTHPVMRLWLIPSIIVFLGTSSVLIRNAHMDDSTLFVSGKQPTARSVFSYEDTVLPMNAGSSDPQKFTGRLPRVKRVYGKLFELEDSSQNKRKGDQS